MNVEEMKFFQNLIAEKCQLQEELEWQKRQYTKLRTISDILQRNGIIYKENNDDMVRIDVYDDEAIKLMEMLQFERRS